MEIRKHIVNKIASNNFLLRKKILKSVGLLKHNTLICGNFYFESLNVVIGENCFINRGYQFYTGNSYEVEPNVIIEDNCYIAMNVALVCGTHEIGDPTKRAGKDIHNKIKIKKGSWIGANTIILPGVTIGDGCVIGAGSLVLHDTEPNSLYVGSPARKIKELS